LAVQSNSIALIDFLLNKNFNPEARDRTLKTPFHYACEKGSLEIVSRLVKKGVSI
jgi:ankyrin repeat protein